MRPLLILALSATVHAADFTPVKLRTEHLENPLAIGTTTPRLLVATRPGRPRRPRPETERLRDPGRQQRRQASTAPDLWSSGKVDSAATSLIPYAGKPLKSRDRAVWRVRSWEAQGRAGRLVRTRLLRHRPARPRRLAGPVDRRRRQPDPPRPTRTSRTSRATRNAAKLIVTPAKHFRKEFEPQKKTVRALLHATALGVYTVEINGEPVGDGFLAPGWSAYSNRIHSQTYDVTS